MATGCQTKNIHTVPTLFSMCQANLAVQIMSLPPLLQEQIVGTTKEKMKIEAEEEASTNFYHKMRDVLPAMIESKCSKIVYRDYPSMIRPLPEEILSKKEEEIGDSVIDAVVQFINPFQGNREAMSYSDEEDSDDRDSDEYFY